MVEVYNEAVRDLLGDDPARRLDVREVDGPISAAVAHLLKQMPVHLLHNSPSVEE